jgi:hypothetical protein
MRPPNQMLTMRAALVLNNQRSASAAYMRQVSERARRETAFRGKNRSVLRTFIRDKKLAQGTKEKTAERKLNQENASLYPGNQIFM